MKKALSLKEASYENVNRPKYISNNSIICDFPAREYSNISYADELFCSDDAEMLEYLEDIDLSKESSNEIEESVKISSNSSLAIKSENYKNTTPKNQSSRGSTRTPKRKVGLSQNADQFKKLYYQVFTSKKKFPKMFVKQIHDIMVVPCYLRKMKREEYRRIDLYFQEFCKYSDCILIYLQRHKEELLELIPELSKLK